MYLNEFLKYYNSIFLDGLRIYLGNHREKFFLLTILVVKGMNLYVLKLTDGIGKR